MTANENPPEQPLAVKLLNGYLEQVDLFGPAFTKAAQDYRDAGLTTLQLTRKTLLDTVERTGHPPPFIHTLSDAASGALSLALRFQCAVVEGGIKAHRQAVRSILDSLTGQKPT